MTGGWESDFEEGNPSFEDLFGTCGGRYWDPTVALSLSMNK